MELDGFWCFWTRMLILALPWVFFKSLCLWESVSWFVGWGSQTLSFRGPMWTSPIMVVHSIVSSVRGGHTLLISARHGQKWGWVEFISRGRERQVWLCLNNQLVFLLNWRWAGAFPSPNISHWPRLCPVLRRTPPQFRGLCHPCYTSWSSSRERTQHIVPLVLIMGEALGMGWFSFLGFTSSGHLVLLLHTHAP